MALAIDANLINNLSFGTNQGAGDHWDGFSTQYSFYKPGNYVGGNLNWGGFQSNSVNNALVQSPYSGYNTNYNANQNNALALTVVNQVYVGYDTNWAAISLAEVASIVDIDIDPVIDHPKDQKVYYKLRGWNTLTSSFESWVIFENITGRPELFDPDPGREPPNVERDIFKTPPSGNVLKDIIILSRWIE